MLVRVTPEWERLERLAAHRGGSAPFDPQRLAALPPASRRYLEAAVAAGTPLAVGARLTMRGSIKLGRWLPFRARQLLVPALGTVWVARVAGVISGSDRYVAGEGGMDWRLLGLVRVAHADGPDVSRSAAGRAAGESIWAPTAIARDCTLTDDGPDGVRVEVAVDGQPVLVEHRLDDAGHITSSSFLRWGDPDDTGTWSPHPFGVEVTGHRTFGGVTIPDRGRAGWHHGTERWEDGIFFRYEITGYELLP
ncbi:MAG: DUF6544 family protein [Microbacteriaceae bacterium]